MKYEKSFHLGFNQDEDDFSRFFNEDLIEVLANGDQNKLGTSQASLNQ